MLKENINERILDSVGRQNYGMYILLTDGKEIDSILNSKNPIFEMYKYRDMLLDNQEDICINMNNLKQSLEQIFLDYLSNNEFEIVKNMLDNHIGGWDINRLLEIHKRYKYHRIFSLLTINYKDWLTI